MVHLFIVLIFNDSFDYKYFLLDFNFESRTFYNVYIQLRTILTQLLKIYLYVSVKEIETCWYRLAYRMAYAWPTAWPTAWPVETYHAKRTKIFHDIGKYNISEAPPAAAPFETASTAHFRFLASSLSIPDSLHSFCSSPSFFLYLPRSRFPPRKKWESNV